MPTPVPPVPAMQFGEMLYRVQKTLGLNQKDLAALAGCSPRTISRYYGGGGSFLPGTYVKLAQACHPHDRALAANLAACAGLTLESLGLDGAGGGNGPATAAHLADSIVCAAAEALDASPRAMRPALRAALERMIALGMTAAEGLAALGPAPAMTKAAKV